MDETPESQKQIARRYRDRVNARFARTPWRRTRFWLSFLAFVGGLAFIYFAGYRTPATFFNPGPVSSQHSALRLKSPKLHLENDCVGCHQPQSFSGMSVAQQTRVAGVLSDRFHHGAPSFERIDQQCQTCHQQHAFHEPNVIANRSCSACHQEHRGPGPMREVASQDCAACHNDRGTMQASAELGKRLPPAQFHLNPNLVNPANERQRVLQLPRPPDGYTKTFASFSDGHPAFQLQRENVREPDVLRFNHQRHLQGADIPHTKSGAKLDCAYCHQPDREGSFMKRVSFEMHCQECHSLQFDVRNPDFQLPHGNAQLVRTVLRTLPAQYNELARRRRGLTSEDRIGKFTAEQIQQLLTQFSSGEELERAVFFTKNPYKASAQSDARTRANFAGCAYCHEVKQAAGVSVPLPEIPVPQTVDRWMPHALFNHEKHAAVSSCRECHVAAASSHLTSDVLMPTKESCVRCHQPTGQAANASDCTTCHVYHAPDLRKPITATTSANVSLKQPVLATTP